MTETPWFLFSGAWLQAGLWWDAAPWGYRTGATTEALLPNNASPLEERLEQVSARIGAVPVAIRDVWDPETCPAHMLPWLAWALSVDEWEPSWPVDRQRAVVSASVSVHRRKGTLAAVRQAITAAGLGDASVREGFGPNDFDGTYDYDAAIAYEAGGHWAEYEVMLTRPMSIAQGEQVRRIIESVAPLRCRLIGLNFSEALNLYDAATAHNGTFSHGVA